MRETRNGANVSAPQITPCGFKQAVRKWRREATHDRPTACYEDVLGTLAYWKGEPPTHAQLARWAGCCVRTVQSALAWARRHGFLDWEHQFVTVRNACYQIANRCRLLSPPSLPSGGHSCRQKEGTSEMSVQGRQNLPPSKLRRFLTKLSVEQTTYQLSAPLYGHWPQPRTVQQQLDTLRGVTPRQPRPQEPTRTVTEQLNTLLPASPTAVEEARTTLQRRAEHVRLALALKRAGKTIA